MNDLAKRASERILGSIARCPLDCFRASQATRPPTAGSEIRFRQATSAPTRILSPIKKLPALPDKETRKATLTQSPVAPLWRDKHWWRATPDAEGASLATRGNVSLLTEVSSPRSALTIV